MTFALKQIEHDFGGPAVLDDVSFSIKTGEVHALLGMNGAGKSTLLHIASGLLTPRKGSLEIDGQPIHLKSPADAAAHGIVFLTQEVDRGLVPQLSVHENLTVALRKNEKRVLFRKGENRALAKAMLTQYGLDLDVDQPVCSLSLYEKQMLSIIRAVSNHAKYLLLDEPTASFDRKEAQKFYQTVLQLKEQGIGIVFITHKLHEVFALSDRITVLRGGRVTLGKAIQETSKEETIQAMTGGETEVVRRAHHEHHNRPVQFSASDISLRSNKTPISLNVKYGEIVAVFGLLGSGKTYLAETLFGLHKPYKPVIKGSAKRIGSPRQAVHEGLAFIPEERGKHGIWKKNDIVTHFSLSFRGWIFRRKELEYTRGLIESFTIRPNSPFYEVGRLSGGNQQKVAIAKWFARQRDVALFDEPMKGIDVASKEAIFQMIESVAAQGTSVLYFTSEPDEAIRIADRIMILVQGEIVAERNASETSIEELMLTAAKEESISGIG